MKISIAMGTYNGGKYIREQLDSLANQTAIPLELVVCDDTSTDDTLGILADFAKTAPFPVRVHSNETRLGFADNFLKAASLCQGDLIGFCDQDDVWYPDKLRVCISALLEADAILCAHDADLCAVDGKLVGYHAAGIDGGLYEPLALNPWGIFFGFTCVFRRGLLQIIDPAIRPEDDRDATKLLSHDGWVYFLANAFGRTVYLPRALAKYRQHGANLFGSNDLTLFQKIHKLVTQYEIYLQKYARLASARAHVLEESAESWPQQYAGQGRRAYSYWNNIAVLYESRRRIGSEPPAIGRFRKIINLWRQGAYATSRNGGLGRRALVEDWVAACTISFSTTGRRLSAKQR